MKLEIVSHCWNYARLLTYQLSSLVLFPPQDVDVTMTVFYCPDDERTRWVIDYFDRQPISHVTWQWWPLERPQLLSRAIGRNLAALQSKGDWIWFADADMCFRDGCLDRLAIIVVGAEGPLVYPSTVQISYTHEIGDQHIWMADGAPRVLDVRPDDFVPIHYSRAIGGAQIVKGDLVRRLGYCNGYRRFQRPSENWRSTREDVAFRRTLNSPGSPVDVPGVYRIRHSRRGQDHPGLQL